MCFSLAMACTRCNRVRAFFVGLYPCRMPQTFQYWTSSSFLGSDWSINPLLILRGCQLFIFINLNIINRNLTNDMLIFS